MENLLNKLTPNQLSIGRGVTFPIQIQSRKLWVANLSTRTWDEQEVRGWYPISGDPQLIEENLQGLLLQQIGSRLRDEEFGNKLESYLEEPCTQVLVFYIEDQIRTLIARYEPRITYKDIQIYSLQQGSLYIRVQYQIKGTPVEEYLDFMINKND